MHNERGEVLAGLLTMGITWLRVERRLPGWAEVLEGEELVHGGGGESFCGQRHQHVPEAGRVYGLRL